MTDLPYTDADIRHEAARQHATLIEDPDFMGVGERMQTSIVPSTEDAGTPRTWDSELRQNADDYEQYNDVQRKIHSLIAGAADLSAWAVDLGAEGLEPDDQTLTVEGDNKPLVRIHCAFHPDLSHRARAGFLLSLAKAMANVN